MSKKRICKFIKEDGEQCNNPCKDLTEWCWMHQGGHLTEEASAALAKGKFGTQNPNFKSGFHSQVLKMMCGERCFMYDECECRTDTDEGRELFGGICFYETDAEGEENAMLQLDGLKKFIIRILKKLEVRINRGLRYEIATGGFLSEPELSMMFRTVSNLAFNLMGIYEKEEMDDLRTQLEEVKSLYEKALKEMKE